MFPLKFIAELPIKYNTILYNWKLYEPRYINIDTKSNQIIGNNTENIFKENFEDFYDIIIDIQSVKDINKGWQIKMNERGKKNYQLYKNKEILKIGVIGNSNKGKSFLLSKISKIKLPSGTSIRTEGLSIKYPELDGYKNIMNIKMTKNILI